MKHLNVHHLPICTSFYMIENKAVVDVCSAEEKLCNARLSIVLNVYGDLCGMTTLGALEIGQEADSDSEDQQMALGYDA